MDLVDICLPTRAHAEIAIRAMQAGRDVLIELPLTTTLEDAQHIVDTQQATGRRAFVDMFSRFSPQNQQLQRAVAEQRYGPLTMLEVENRTALLWPGYDLTLNSLALDMMHADFDLIIGLLGRPTTLHISGLAGLAGRGSAATILFDYPEATARISGSALMPQRYGMRGGWRATFADAVLEYAVIAGFTGQGPATLIEYTADDERAIALPAANPYSTMIDHVLACLAGEADNTIEPASALTALQLTLEAHHQLTQRAQ